jgi:hypothetical protein
MNWIITIIVTIIIIVVAVVVSGNLDMFAFWALYLSYLIFTHYWFSQTTFCLLHTLSFIMSLCSLRLGLNNSIILFPYTHVFVILNYYLELEKQLRYLLLLIIDCIGFLGPPYYLLDLNWPLRLYLILLIISYFTFLLLVILPLTDHVIWTVSISKLVWLQL